MGIEPTNNVRLSRRIKLLTPLSKAACDLRVSHMRFKLGDGYCACAVGTLSIAPPPSASACLGRGLSRPLYALAIHMERRSRFVGTIVRTSLAWDDSANTNTGAEG